MWQKMQTLPLMMYLTVTSTVKSFVKTLKDDERGLSGVVVAVLLVLVAVLAIVAIWGGLSGWLQDLWENITGQGNSIKGIVI